MTINLSEEMLAKNLIPGECSALIQSLADGCTLTMAAHNTGMRVEKARVKLIELQRKYELKSLLHLVAHYHRNGWIVSFTLWESGNN